MWLEEEVKQKRPRRAVGDGLGKRINREMALHDYEVNLCF